MEFSERFRIHFANPVNLAIDQADLVINILDNDLKIPVKTPDGVDLEPEYPGMSSAWSDEFDGGELNDNDWNHELGGGGWGNNELEVYTDHDENVFTENGKLVIRAIDSGNGYTSGRITTQGKQTFQYGLVDIRARLPEGQGIWPALWMLGTNIETVSWPKCGEIDIMELVGHQPYIVYGTAHYDENGHKMAGGNTSSSINNPFSDEYHIYSLLWEEDRLVWYVDYKKFFELKKSSVGVSWPFNSTFFFIFNVAVGGNWPGYPDDTTIFPQEMSIDYIRVYEPAS
jgi:beta-glucanase (GH16 family)